MNFFSVPRSIHVQWKIVQKFFNIWMVKEQKNQWFDGQFWSSTVLVYALSVKRSPLNSFNLNRCFHQLMTFSKRKESRVTETFTMLKMIIMKRNHRFEIDELNWTTTKKKTMVNGQRSSMIINDDDFLSKFWIIRIIRLKFLKH